MYIDNEIALWLVKLVDGEYINGVKTKNELSDKIQKEYNISI
jgi:hypothetical protein